MQAHPLHRVWAGLPQGHVPSRCYYDCQESQQHETSRSSSWSSHKKTEAAKGATSCSKGREGAGFRPITTNFDGTGWTDIREAWYEVECSRLSPSKSPCMVVLLPATTMMPRPPPPSGSPIEPVSRHFPGWWPACCRLVCLLSPLPPLISAVLPPGNCPYLTGTAVSCNGDTYLIVNGVARWA